MQSIVRRLSAALAGSPAFGVLITASLVAALTIPTPAASAKEASMTRPTVVLLHGAFAESSSWNTVTTKLLARGYPVIAVANPLRGVKSDAT